jgi:hypothetical protein
MMDDIFKGEFAPEFRVLMSAAPIPKNAESG